MIILNEPTKFYYLEGLKNYFNAIQT
jgi:hypothetical protein